MYTIFINGALAFAIVIAMLFCLSDLNAALEAQQTMYYPFLQIFSAAVSSRPGAVIMAVIVLVLAIASMVGIYATASRMLWSFSRDGGLPLAKHLVKVRGCYYITFFSI
jgi:choline transport protein